LAVPVPGGQARDAWFRQVRRPAQPARSASVVELCTPDAVPSVEQSSAALEAVGLQLQVVLPDAAPPPEPAAQPTP